MAISQSVLALGSWIMSGNTSSLVPQQTTFKHLQSWTALSKQVGFTLVVCVGSELPEDNSNPMLERTHIWNLVYCLYNVRHSQVQKHWNVSCDILKFCIHCASELVGTTTPCIISLMSPNNSRSTSNKLQESLKYIAQHYSSVCDNNVC